VTPPFKAWQADHQWLAEAMGGATSSRSAASPALMDGDEWDSAINPQPVPRHQGHLHRVRELDYGAARPRSERLANREVNGILSVAT
jgi:hypothetical protein